jgi:uncharacterized protein YyaL (SSP411 family)
MHRRALATFFPRKVVTRLTPANAAGRTLPPALAAMLDSPGQVRAFLCVGTSCRMPVESDAEWAQLLTPRPS